MSVFDVTKTANPTDNRQAVDAEGQALQSVSAASRDQSLTFGGIANTNKLGDDLSASSAVKNEASGIALGGTNNKNQIGGVQVGGAVSGGITVNSSEGVEAVTRTFADTVKEFISGRPADASNGVPLKPGSEDKPAATESTFDAGRVLLWGVGIVLTILAGWWFSRSKKKSA